MELDAGYDSGAQPRPEGHLVRADYTLEGGGSRIAVARRHAVAFLDRMRTEYGLPISQRVRDLTELVVSELVTNAHKYALGPVLMQMRVGAGGVDIVVWDSDPAIPVVRAADPGRAGHHGLEIIKKVAERLFVEREPVGKRITARLALVDIPSAA
ncbi:ATP-binding protein [Streptomyces sp. WAC08241]|uniref:ATP-binding protein n=1 Tax=Streptomyces sp. WAC08241 TaxID=2487421 RepID=UPI0021B020D2|nr:ATP-binding protein [Streptomyces sp. WAC08241]